MSERLEKDFNIYMKLNRNIWFMKIPVNKQSYTGTPADFILLGKYRYLVECKENRSNRYNFIRSGQVKRMQKFEQHTPDNKAFFLINFWKGNKRKSLYYLIPLKRYMKFEKETGKQSGNIDDFANYLSEFQIDIEDVGDIFL